MRTEVQVARPAIVTEAIMLARLYEACNQGTRNLFGMNIKEPEPLPLPFSSLIRSQEPVVKRLSPAKLQARRDYGFCFNCDEYFMPRHHCKKLFFLEGIYLEEDDLDDGAFLICP